MKNCRLIEPPPPTPSRSSRPRTRPLREIVDALVYVLRDGGVFEKINRMLFIADGERGSRDVAVGREIGERKPRASRPHGPDKRRPQLVQARPPESLPQTRQDGMTVIRKTPGVRRGAACIGDSNVPVWIIALMSEAGAGVEEILAAYPQLTPADCAAALNYALMHRAEIDADITWG
jgi:uncharacterized protein (DUF433 family)